MLGAIVWSPEGMLLFLPVLLLHEVGHLVAMKMGGYQDIRLVFVPLLGAVVTGRPIRKSPTAQAVVSLAGPLPGILIAALLCYCGLTEVRSLKAAALVLLSVNGFNLLPLPPLDGGVLLQSLILNRNPSLDFWFRCLSISGLTLTSILISNGIPVVLGLLLLPGLKRSFHRIRIHARLSKKSSASDRNFERDSILAAVQEEFPGRVLQDQSAEAWLQHFQDLQTTRRIPWWFHAVVGSILLVSIITTFTTFRSLMTSEQQPQIPTAEPWTHEY